MIEAFHKPKSLSEALSLKKEFGAQTQFLAGGTVINARECNPAPKDTLTKLIQENFQCQPPMPQNP